MVELLVLGFSFSFSLLGARIYFFRNNRLMAGGDWYGIRTDHPMLAGTRIEVNIMGIADTSGLIQLDYKLIQLLDLLLHSLK